MSQIDDFLNDSSPAAPATNSAAAPAKKATSEVDDFLSDAPSQARGITGMARDMAAWGVKGAIGVPEAAVGLADIVSGGRVGKALENEGGAVGFRPKQAREMVNDWHSDATKDAQRKFQEADGIGGKLQAAIENPSNVAGAVIESLPAMGGGAVAARGLMGATRLGQMGVKGATAAGAAGEGIMMAGSQAEAIRQETPDGLLTPAQAGIAAATGGIGGLIGGMSGRLANRLGVGDADTMLAQGARGLARQNADEAAAAAANPLVQQSAKSVPRQVIEGAITEGLLEELPQSVAEQLLQNLALDKPWSEGLDDAIVMGVLSGGAMGAGAAGFRGITRPGEATPDAAPSAGPAPTPVPPGAGQPPLGLPAPSAQGTQEQPPIQVDANGVARTQPYQAPGYVGAGQGDVTDVVPKTRQPGAQFADLLDNDSVYNLWSNVRDGSDRSVMRDQMEYVAKTYAGKVTPENMDAAGKDLAQQFKWFRNAQPEERVAALNALVAPPAPIKPSEAMGLDAAAGALSAAAVQAVDSGASDTMQAAAAQAQAAEEAAKAPAPTKAQAEEIDLADIADPYERAYYESFFADAEDAQIGPEVQTWLQDDTNLPDLDAASSASDEDFLRALGANDQEITDAIASIASQPSRPQEDAQSLVGAQANEPADAGQGAGEAARTQGGQVDAGAPADAGAAVPAVGAAASDDAGRGATDSGAYAGETGGQPAAAAAAPGSANAQAGNVGNAGRVADDALKNTPNQPQAQAQQAQAAINQGAKNGPQADQAQQVGTQQTQAGAAQAGAGQDTGLSPAAPAQPAAPPVVLQNRDRNTAASIAQMNAIAAKPDYLRTGQSRTMDQGAPVVFGDTPASAVVGRPELVVDGRGDRISTRYAVMEAADLLTSNSADGTTNADYSTGMPGKLRAVAGNGRGAGLVEGYRRGTTGAYRAELEQDAQAVGIDPAQVRAMKSPVLVRVMDAADVTPDIGDRSNTVATARLSPVEEAANDGQRIDLAAIEFGDNGEPMAKSIAGFVQSMPESERGNMLNADGTHTRQATDRLMAAVFKQAYGSDAMVQLYAQATDPEARAVMSALAQAAGPMAQLTNAGEFDMRSAVAEAAGMAVNAVRKGQKLADVVKNLDLDTSPDTYIVAEFMAQNMRSAKAMGEGLRNLAQKALEQVGIALDNALQQGMFGAQPTLTRANLLDILKDNDAKQPAPAAQQNRPEPDAQLAQPDRAERPGKSTGPQGGGQRGAEPGREGGQDAKPISLKEGIAKARAKKKADTKAGESPAAQAQAATDLVAQPSAEGYFKGDKGRYTGKTQTIAGALFHELQMLEGHNTGSIKLVKDGPESDTKQSSQPKTSKAATPQVASAAQLASMISIAADGIAKLRVSDVDRVISEAPEHFKESLVAHIKAMRPDLAGEVDEVRADGAPPLALPPPTKADAMAQQEAAANKAMQHLLGLKTTKLIHDDGRGRKLYDVKVSVPFRIKNFVRDRMPLGSGLEIKNKADVTGNVYDDGYVLIDNREQIASRSEPQRVNQADPAADAQAPLTEAQLEELDLIREFRGRWQYRMTAGATNWFTDNTKEGAMAMGQKAYDDAAAQGQTPKTKAQMTAEADAKYDAENERLFGGKSLGELEAMHASMTAEIASLQSAGKREFGDGARRTSAAVSNEGARDVGSMKMRLDGYMRAKQAAAEAPALDLTAPTKADVLAQQERIEQSGKKDAQDQVRRESEIGDSTFMTGFSEDGRQDNTGSLFDAPAPAAAPKPAAAPASYGAKNTLVSQSRADELRAKLRDKAKNHLFGGLDTEMMAWGTELAAFHMEAGVRKFADFVATMASDLGTTPSRLKPYLRSWYNGARDLMEDHGLSIEGMDSAEVVRAEIAKIAAEAQDKTEPQGKNDAPDTNARVERDSPVATPEPAVGDAVQDDAGAAARRPAKAGGQTSRSDGGGQQDSAGVPFGSAPVAGERGDQPVPAGNPAPELESIIAGADFGERGGDSGIVGVPPDSIPASQVAAAADQSATGLKAGIERARADKAAVNPKDIESIRATLPQLLPGQQEDVLKAEARFADPKGYGMLFTNGTGTGKTFSGLGVIKRFALQGKTNSLVIVPDDKIASDWIDSAKLLGLDVTALKSTKDAGRGIVITSYANLGENDALASRQWDLVVADEAHTLMQSADGAVTSYLRNLRAITNHPDGAGTRHEMLNRDKLDEQRAINEKIKNNNTDMGAADAMPAAVAAMRAENARLEPLARSIEKELRESMEAVRAQVASSQGAPRTRMVALSATPFAYEKTVDWANGYLFEYADGYPYGNDSRAYNQPDPREYFFQTRFGYRMRFNKLTAPDSKVDSGLMQRQFNANLKKSGALSGRMLDVKPDYDRRFVLVKSAIGNRIDEAMEWLWDAAHSAEKGNSGPRAVAEAINNQFKYLQKRYLLEAIKATEVVPIVKQHMALGRKVVVFHDYKKGGGFNPFKVTRPTGVKEGWSSDDKSMAQFNDALTLFNEKFPDLVNSNLGDMDSPIEVFKRELPGVLLVNGDEKKADLLKRYKSFQDDGTGPQVMLVQSAKNKGWSGHDTTGKHQRVLINLGQPTAPTLAIQQEGRIYRTGQASDAIMRYLNTGTNWERWTFASTIASRASTAENLGMGEMARALKDSFIQSFEESDAYAPGHEGEGKGGKARDAAANNALTEYDRAKSLYFSNAKKTSRTKAQEGVDYFATPEPVGLKMVEWLDVRGGESLLEPSGGHGAIARWFPEKSDKTVIEPGLALRSRLALAMNAQEDRIIAGTFEEHSVMNKYDGIAMNPPFGVGGKTAIEHLTKAATHLREGGRIAALIPVGPMADKRFDKWLYESAERPVRPLYIDLNHGPIYRGDTLTLGAFGPETEIVVAHVDSYGDVRYVRAEGIGKSQAANVIAIKKVKPTGKRTEQYSPTSDLRLVASILLPQSTFERAGTSVMTRIVVIEKQADDSTAPASATKNTDLSNIESTEELFNVLEGLSLPKRQKAEAAEAPESAGKSAPTKDRSAPTPRKAAEVAPAAEVGGTVTLGGKPYKIDLYTTNAGKELRGAWLPTRAEALEFGSSTFQKRPQGWFVRERDFPKGSIQADAGAPPAFSRTPAAQAPTEDSNERLVATQLLVDGLTAKWTRMPEVIVARNMQDLVVPQRVRDYDAKLQSQGADGEARGFIYGGKVYLLSDKLKGPEQIAQVLFHEVLGHYGLRGAFGESLTPILQQIGTMRRADVLKKARAYGMIPKTMPDAEAWSVMSEKDRQSAAEEVLAEMAETQPNHGFVKRAISAIRNWLRANVPGFKDLALTDEDIVQAYILPARGFVTRSKETGEQSIERAMGAFSRTPGQTAGTGRIRRTLDELVAAAEGQQSWQTWYDRHDAALAKLFGDDAAVFQKILSATSQAATVKSNVGLALKAYDQMLSELPFTGYLPAVIKNLDRIRGEQALQGAKISQYGEANEGNAEAIAVDRHISMLFFNTKTPNRMQIQSAKARIRKIAERLQWEPRQAQAALWAFNQVRLGSDPAQVQSYDTILENKADLIAALRSKHQRGEGGSLPPGGGTRAGNPEGQASAESASEVAFGRAPADQTQTEAFKKWFGDWQDPKAFGSRAAGPVSYAVQKDGSPMRLYHATNADFVEFESGRSTINSTTFGDIETSRHGIFTTPDAAFAQEYLRPGAGQNVMPVYMSIKSPLDMREGLNGDDLSRVMKFADDQFDESAFYGLQPTEHWQLFDDELGNNFVDSAIKAGFDGAILREKSENGKSTHDVYVAFRPEQIKSSTGNNGNFDPANPDIRFSRTKLNDLKNTAIDQIHQTMSHPGKVSLWDKTVGTMRHLAERNPAFKPVFESAQRRIDDVSMMANDAADAAPRILPRLESWSDLGKQPVDAADNKAIGKALFEGTLSWARDASGKPVLVNDMQKQYANLDAEAKAKLMMDAGQIDAGVLKMWRGLPIAQFESLIDSRFESKMLKAGVVWSDKELKNLLGMSDQQVGLYREARAAIDRSIDMTSRASMLRLVGEKYAGLRDVLLEQPTLQGAMDLLASTLMEDAKADPDASDLLMQQHNQVVDLATKARDLMDAGYMPLSRFGKYTLDVVDAAGERQYFSMFESQREANLMKLQMASAFPGATIVQGTMSEQAFKLFQGVTPESLEMFGNMLGLDSEGADAKDKAFQAYVQLAKNNHSSMKRLIHRKGIAGYSEDVGRTLASFVYSNARQAAGAMNAGTMEKAIEAIPQAQGELRDVAMGLRSYIQDPQEEGQAVRGMLFAQYLGGSIASAFVNTTQPFAVTLPWLSQFGGITKAGKFLAGALKDMGTRGFKYEPGLAKALQAAQDDGTVSPQEIHQLMAQSRGAGGLRSGDGTRTGDARAAAANNWERVKVGWGQPFALAEQFNRRSTFIAAYRMAQANGEANPAAFASKAVLETQFLYSKANKMKWGRGTVGGTLMTFKTYSISYLELMQRTWNAGAPGSPERAAGRRAVGWGLAMLMLMGGAGGLPFMEDVEDLIDALAQLMGYNVSSKQWRKQAMQDVMGKELAEFMSEGLSGLPGAPIDVSGRLGMGNLIPGTGLFQTKQSHTRDMLELAGPAGDLVGRAFSGAGRVLKGDIAGAALEVSPTAARNVAKGVGMAINGAYTDAKGYKVLDTTIAEALAKGAGFQPKSVADVQEATSFVLRSKSFYTQTSSDIRAQWAKALYEKDDAAVQRVRERLDGWNQKNPGQRITIRMPDVWKRVREMGKDRDQRIADTAPKALRAKIREDLAQARS